MMRSMNLGLQLWRPTNFGDLKQRRARAVQQRRTRHDFLAMQLQSSRTGVETETNECAVIKVAVVVVVVESWSREERKKINQHDSHWGRLLLRRLLDSRRRLVAQRLRRAQLQLGRRRGSLRSLTCRLLGRPRRLHLRRLCPFLSLCRGL